MYPLSRQTFVYPLLGEYDEPLTINLNTGNFAVLLADVPILLPLAQIQGTFTGLFLITFLGAVIGASTVLLVLLAVQQRRLYDAHAQARKVLAEADEQAKRAYDQALAEASIAISKRREAFELETDARRGEMAEKNDKLERREDELEKELKLILERELNLEKRQNQLIAREKEVETERSALGEEASRVQAELVRASGLSAEEARASLLKSLEQETARECGELIQRLYENAVQSAQLRARDVILTAIQRWAAPSTVAGTVATVDLPSEEMKGRVIGREGRNIRAFEKASGTELIVDDTPGVVSVSCFDPVRREVAVRSLKKLIEDGRIHPVRIEEVVAETSGQVQEQIKEYGEKAAQEAEVPNLPPRLVELLGRLHFRTSYAQNVLAHCVEVAMLSGLMAAELKLDAALARRAGLLHDIGKALDHEVEGSHTVIGSDLLARLNEPPEVVNAAAAHHGDVPPAGLYTLLVTAADSISASRPGARRDTLERYVKRMQELEKIVTGFPGVVQCFAVQAGREIRVIVDAAQVNDVSAQQIARDIAKRIEAELTYPGEIRVSLVREMKVVEYAR